MTMNNPIILSMIVLGIPTFLGVLYSFTMTFIKSDSRIITHFTLDLINLYNRILNVSLGDMLNHFLGIESTYLGHPKYTISYSLGEVISNRDNNKYVGLKRKRLRVVTALLGKYRCLRVYEKSIKSI